MKMPYIIVGILSGIVLIAIALPFTLNIFKVGDQAAIDKQVIAEDTQILNEYRDGSSLAAQEAYVKAANERLADGDVSDPARNLILLRKAAVLSQARGDAASLKQKVAEATKIYIDFINRPNPNESDLYFRDFAIVAVTRLQLQCCQVASDLMSSSEVFNTNYNQYLSAGYSKSLAALLALDVATSKMSKARQSDAMNRLNSLDIAAKVLSGYNDQLLPATREALIKELGDGIAAYPSLKPLTYNDPSNAFEAAFKLAIAFDWFKSLSPGGKTASVNAEIDRQYEDAQAAVKLAMGNVKDIHGLNEIMFYNQIYYLESLDRRYGGAVNATKKNDTIASLLNIINTTPTVADLGKLYFQGLQDWKTSNPEEYKKLMSFNHFVDLGKTNADVAAYLKTIGVTP